MAHGTAPASAAAEQDLSAECALAGRDGYENLHGTCTQLADVPMPGTPRITLVRRCSCKCHQADAR